MPRKLNELSIGEQKELLVCYDGANLQYISKHRAAQMLNVSRSALRTLLENRKAIEGRPVESAGTSATTTAATDDNSSRSLTLDDVEKCLFRFFVQMINLNMPVTDDILLSKARVVAAQCGLKNFVPTRSWLIYWKYKNSIPFDPAVAGRETDFNRLANDKWLNDLVRYAASVYRGDDVYGLVETGLYFPPSGRDPGVRSQRLSVLFLCNVTGTVKKRPVVIENDFRQARFNALATNHYASFLKKWSQELGPKKILLVLDNRSAHPAVEVHNIEIKYLPKSVVHPLGQNIVRVAKTFENRTLSAAASAAAGSAESGPTTTSRASWDYTVSEYVNTLLNTWDRMSSTDIRDCYRAIGFVMPARENQVGRLCSPKNEEDRAQQQQQQQQPSTDRTPKADDPPRCCVSPEENLPLNLCKKDVVTESQRIATVNDDDDDDDDQCNIPTTVIAAASVK